MKRILVIGGHSTDTEDAAELAAFVQGVAGTTRATIDAAHIDDMQWSIAPGQFEATNGKNERPLDSYDLIILRNKMRTYHNVAYALSRYCHDRRITFFNDYSAYFPATKLAQAIIFYEETVPFLHTVYAANHVLLRKALLQNLSFPCVLKDSRGAKGASNYLVHTTDELDTILSREPQTDFIAQEYCPNDCDYRILILGKYHLIIKRTAQDGSHLNNTSHGALATLETDRALPLDLLTQARQLMQTMHLTIAGIDVMPRTDTDSFYFLETNAQPQIFTGSFVPEKQKLFAAMLDDLS